MTRLSDAPSATGQHHVAESRSARLGASSRPIRVLHVTAVETNNYYLNNLVDHTDPREVEISVATLAPEGSFVAELHKRGIAAYALGATHRSDYPRALLDLARIQRRHDAQIIHGHLVDPSALATVLAKKSGSRLVLTRHHSDAVHRLPNGLKRRAYLALERWMCAAASAIIAPSQRVYDTLVGAESIPPHKVLLIPYGQTRDRFEAITEDDIARVRGELSMGGHFSLVCVSRLHQEKGHDYLLPAFSRLVADGTDAVLYLAGVGPERKRLERLIGELGMEKVVRLLGWRDDVLAIVASADLFVHPSLHEALSSAVIEALILKRPIVATDVSGVRDVLGESEFGVVVPPADSDALYQAISSSLRDLSSLRRRASDGAAKVLNDMDAGRVARAHTQCYGSVL